MTAGVDDSPLLRHRELTACVRQLDRTVALAEGIGDHFKATVQSDARHFGHGLIDILYVETVSIGRPVRGHDGAVETAADDTRMTAISVHHMESHVLIGNVAVGVA